MLSIGSFFSCDQNDVLDSNSEYIIVTPNGGETFLAGNRYLIEWSIINTESIRIKLYKSDKGVAKITDSALNTGSFNWIIPEEIEEGDDFTIKISSNEDDFIFVRSEFPFTILKKPNEFSELIDSRDGQIYKTVKIGDQWWMSQNFNLEQAEGSFCYNNDNNNCDAYGALYDISSAIELAPPGWHLPSDSEWKILESYLGIPVESINKEGFRGVNTGLLLKEEGGLSFDAKFAGYGSFQYSFYQLGTNALFWTSTKNSTYYQWARELSIEQSGVSRTRMYSGSYALSVRYVKDE